LSRRTNIADVAVYTFALSAGQVATHDNARNQPEPEEQQ
jgi:hypothetical protein